jgi:5-formyltetrahydrofolate cyclo-ligase
MTINARWAGRNGDKDTLRHRVWEALESTGVGIPPIRSAIPNFVGAEEAAARLAETSFWKEAKVIKSNPDAPQIPVRRRALEDGKLLYTPVPELTSDLPFVLLDPKDLAARGISFADAAIIGNALKYGVAVDFDEMQPMDVLVVGCVAVCEKGGRTGKGGGFADLELGIFREVGTIAEGAKIVTTVHDIQVVSSDELPMQDHDSPLDYIYTPTRTITTNTTYKQPTGVAWDFVRNDQFRDIPFLAELRDRLSVA